MGYFDWADYVPGVANTKAAIEGRWSDALDPFQSTENIYGAYRKANAEPFDEKREGYDAVIAETQRLKAERMARKDKTYNMAEEKYRPAREAIDAVYGDPKNWKL